MENLRSNFASISFKPNGLFEKQSYTKKLVEHRNVVALGKLCIVKVLEVEFLLFLDDVRCIRNRQCLGVKIQSVTNCFVGKLFLNSPFGTSKMLTH